MEGGVQFFFKIPETVVIIFSVFVNLADVYEPSLSDVLCRP
jgi:hypothetical protein